jgi:SIR2-like domain
MPTISSGIIQVIADHISKGKCILFLGAGVHYPPPSNSRYHYPEEKRPPTGSALSERLAKGCGFEERFPKESITNLQRVSLCYEVDYQRKALIEEIKAAVDTGKEPSPILRALARLNFPLIFTTNYDALFEKALYGAGKGPTVVIYNKLDTVPTPDIGSDDPTPEEPYLLKLHGDIARPESIVITDEDYIHFVMRMSDKDPYRPVPRTVLSFFTRWPTLFVGYSLMDYNLRLLFKTMRWNVDKGIMPNTYSIDLRPDPLILNVWQDENKYVKFVAQDVWEFVPTLYRLLKNEEMAP